MSISVGDRVAFRNYLAQGEDNFGTVLRIENEKVYAEDWTVGVRKGWLPICDADLTYLSEIPVSRTDEPRADLAVAYPASEGCIGFTLTVAGKPQQFTMTRSAAASFIGRMAGVLAK